MKAAHLSMYSDLIKDIPDAQSAVDIIDVLRHPRGDHLVSAKDLKWAQKQLSKYHRLENNGKTHKSQLGDLHDIQIDILEKQLPLLKTQLTSLQKEKKQKAPFCTCIKIELIGKNPIRQCAQFIANHFGEGQEALNLSEINAAQKAFTDYTSKSVSNSVDKTEDAFMNAVDKGIITEEYLKELHHYFLTGNGTLLSFGPLYFAGRRMDEVYKIPVPKDIAITNHQSAVKVVEHYEQFFNGCGFDRIYTLTNDNQLLLTLNSHGPVSRIKRGHPVQMKSNGNLVDSARVIECKDETNGLSEASYLFWGRFIHRLVSGFNKNVDNTLTTQVDRIGTGLGRSVGTTEAEKSTTVFSLFQKPEFSFTLLAGGGLAAGLGQLAKNYKPWMLPVFILSLPTAVQAAKIMALMYTLGQRDKAHLLQILGVTISNPKRIKN